MSENDEKRSNVNINPTFNKEVGTANVAQQIGDTIESGGAKITGDQSNVQVGDNNSQDIEQHMTKSTGPGAELFDAIRTELSVSDSVGAGELMEPDVADHEPQSFSADVVADAEQYAAELVESTPEQEASVAAMEPLAFFNTFEAEVSKPEPEQDAGLLSAIVRNTKRFGPLVLRAGIAAGEAYLKSTMKSSPWVAAGLAVVSTVKRE